MTGLFRATLRLIRPFWFLALAGTVVGALSGLATMWLLSTVNKGLHAETGLDTAMIVEFAGLCAISIGGSALSGIANTSVGQRVVAALRKDVADRILRMPLVEVERYGGYRLLAILTTDIDMISGFALQFPSVLIAWAIALGSFAYLLLLSKIAFALSAVAASLGIFIGYLGQQRWTADYEGARSAEDELRKHYRAITEGAKELRLNRQRRTRVHSFLLSGAIERIAGLRTLAMRRVWAVDAAIGVLYFAAIGALLAVGPKSGGGSEALTGAVLVMLFARASLEQIISSLSLLGMARASFRRITALPVALESVYAPQTAGDSSIAGWNEIELRNVRHQFGDNGNSGERFVLGPLSVRIRQGETTFIVGENGSGKTTLMKLLLGLYSPQEGSLLLDGCPVPPEHFDAYRQMFSAVFFDYFLFDELPTGTESVSKRAIEVLNRFAIAHKVRVEGNAFTTTDLSSGERKRLALVQVLIENRPIMMFDEWAADQDPTFRRVFYREILPELKRLGKTLIVISHDDRYFDASDRIVRMANGKIVPEPKHGAIKVG
jgi:putative ATP-binding cassette transporter